MRRLITTGSSLFQRSAAESVTSLLWRCVWGQTGPLSVQNRAKQGGPTWSIRNCRAQDPLKHGSHQLRHPKNGSLSVNLSVYLYNVVLWYFYYGLPWHYLVVLFWILLLMFLLVFSFSLLQFKPTLSQLHADLKSFEHHFEWLNKITRKQHHSSVPKLTDMISHIKILINSLQRQVHAQTRISQQTIQLLHVCPIYFLENLWKFSFAITAKNYI